ncbi:MAG TPA: protein kinase [Planctomycetota bacterium]|jgi:serine/threonine-protein kinase
MADPATPPVPAAPGGSAPLKMIGGYELVSKIGQGAMGSVLKARQVSLDRIVALKVLPPSVAKDAQFIERFQREARASARLNHPHIVQGIDVGQDAATGLWYFAMEYVDGPSLKQVLVSEKVIPEERALKITRDVAGALECVAANGMVHRDIKPDNILMTLAGEPKLADLGLARQTKEDSNLTRSGMALGTPFYMAPEQARGESTGLDIRTDLYALGATLFHLVTGKPPFDGETTAAVMAKHLQEPPPQACKVNPQVSESTSRMIQRLMQKKKEARFQTPAELVQHIDRILTGKATGPQRAIRTTGPRQPVGTRPEHFEPAAEKSSPVLLYAGIAGAVLAAVGLVYALKGRTPDQNAASVQEKKSEAAAVKPAAQTKASGAGDVRARMDALFAAAQQFERANAEDFPAIQRKYEDVIANAKRVPEGAETVAKAQDAAAGARQRAEKAAASVLQALEEKAQPLITANDYDGALAVFAEVPPKLAEFLRDKAFERSTAVRKEGQERIQPAIAAADEAAKTDPQKALDALAKAEGIKLAPYSDQLAALKKKLQDQPADSDPKRTPTALDKKQPEANRIAPGVELAGLIKQAVALSAESKYGEAAQLFKVPAATLEQFDSFDREMVTIHADAYAGLAALKGAVADKLKAAPNKIEAATVLSKIPGGTLAGANDRELLIEDKQIRTSRRWDKLSTEELLAVASRVLGPLPETISLGLGVLAFDLGSSKDDAVAKKALTGVTTPAAKKILWLVGQRDEAAIAQKQAIQNAYGEKLFCDLDDAMQNGKYAAVAAKVNVLRTKYADSAIMKERGGELDTYLEMAQIAQKTGALPIRGNVALASAGATCTGSPTAAKLIDGNTTEYDRSSGFAMLAFPGEFIITLPNVCVLKQIRVLLWDGELDRFYRYAIETSHDGQKYVPLVDRSKGQWRSWQQIDFPPRPVKSIKLKGLYNSANTTFHAVELEAYCIPPEKPAKPRTAGQ